MAKKKSQDTTSKPFTLSGRAAARLNKYLAEIKKGIVNVCELHTHDSAPALKKADFEVMYIDSILGQTANKISFDMHSMVEALKEQKTQEIQAAIDSKTQPTTGKEDK